MVGLINNTSAHDFGQNNAMTTQTAQPSTQTDDGGFDPRAPGAESQDIVPYTNGHNQGMADLTPVETAIATGMETLELQMHHSNFANQQENLQTRHATEAIAMDLQMMQFVVRNDIRGLQRQLDLLKDALPLLMPAANPQAIPAAPQPVAPPVVPAAAQNTGQIPVAPQPTPATPQPVESPSVPASSQNTGQISLAPHQRQMSTSAGHAAEAREADNVDVQMQEPSAPRPRVDLAAADRIIRHGTGKAKRNEDHSATNPATPSASGSEKSDVIMSDDDPAHKLMLTKWRPLVVREMQPPSEEFLASIPSPDEMSTFTLHELVELFGGNMYSSGFFYNPLKEPHQSILPGKGYWIIDGIHEPYLATKPGMHGAKLTAFLNDGALERPENVAPDTVHEQVPLFVNITEWIGATPQPVKNKDKYVYMGTYSLLRFSDRLDYDRMVEAVPETVKKYWAVQLSEVGRPNWVTKGLKEFFWPKPTFQGEIPGKISQTTGTNMEPSAGNATGGTMSEKTVSALKNHALALEKWEKETNVKVSLLTPEDILEAFKKADAGHEPGLRLWWEYFECVMWDGAFYQMLVNMIVKKRKA
ncbi:hypothetical protein LTR66_007929 [Elasticomyces elasticus]|nr:hypothetical protein LTR66_007929 [Elasticomyces elasticus]